MGKTSPNYDNSMYWFALIQTFPKTYKFFADEEYVAITKASRYIGNAVPPRLGEVIAESILTHITANKLEL